MRLAPHSIFWRITWLQVLALTAAYAVMLFAIQLILNQTTVTFQRATLREHEAPIAQALHYGLGGWSLALPSELRSVYDNHYGGFAFAVVNGQGKVLDRSAPARLRFEAARLDPQRPTYFRQRIGRSIYYGASFPEHRSGATAWVEMAQDIDNPDVVFDDIVDAFLPQTAWLFAALLVLLILIDVVIVRRGLKPVLEASQLAREIGPATINVRLPSRNMPTEIAPLVRAVNQALDRLQGGFDAQREFTADAAHEIRTPLTVLRLHVDTLKDTATANVLRPYLEAMSHIVEQLLAIAELETVSIEPQDRTDLHRTCVRVAELMAPVAASQHKAIAVIGEPGPIWVRGREELLFQAVRNLVENAIQHSPEHAAVRIQVSPPATVTVVDSGEGVPEEQRALMFRRFWRADRRKSKGAGLGLAIVSRIVQAHGGHIQVGSGPEGGAEFRIDLIPAASPTEAAAEP